MDVYADEGVKDICPGMLELVNIIRWTSVFIGISGREACFFNLIQFLCVLQLSLGLSCSVFVLQNENTILKLGPS